MGRIPHPVLKGPNLIVEIGFGIFAGACAGLSWKMHQWNEQKKVKTFYELLDRGDISLVPPE